MINDIISVLEDSTRVTVYTGHNNVYSGYNVNVGFGEDPRNPGKDMDYMIVRASGDVDCWIPTDIITSIEIHMEKS